MTYSPQNPIEFGGVVTLNKVLDLLFFQLVTVTTDTTFAVIVDSDDFDVLWCMKFAGVVNEELCTVSNAVVTTG